MNIRINQAQVSPPAGLTTWGELLDWLETDYFHPGECITRVKFGSDEAIDYREQDLCGRALNILDMIDVESGDFDTVVRQSLAELEQEIDRVTGSGTAIVGLFEKRDQESAYQALAEYLESVGRLFTIFSEDLGWVHGPEGDPRSALVAALEHALGELIRAQENGFWISVCDVIEYEIAPVLDGWKALARRTREHIQ